ncbi:hypothetical protein HMPREF1318_1045 [Actinomyces massiliensis F0489]|uniref:Uncharacterized protein n=1 Tax=Actinomyces massiliensis F0489 TaxID=1125718 RepID=J0N9S7_9ACTO|nr:hypothetical protein HMPREF1318_1045 [Actinomyces massiliensis F0489]
MSRGVEGFKEELTPATLQLIVDLNNKTMKAFNSCCRARYGV